MFTGIVEALGHIRSVIPKSDDLSLVIASNDLDWSDVKLGDSIAVNGVCLTVVALEQNAFRADVSTESLANTCIKTWRSGDTVNLEKALTLSTRLGGHLVSGHVDGVGSIVRVRKDGRSLRYDIDCAAELLRYIAEKGSITVDGVSLTVTHLTQQGFALNIVPHTAEQTIISRYQVGSTVHLEVDLMARYAERLLQKSPSGKNSEEAGIDRQFLSANGYSAF